MTGPHSGLDPASGPPGPPGVCAATSLQVEDEDEEEEEERPGDLLEMEAATAAAAAETRPTPGGALSRGSPAWFRKSGEVTRPGLPGAALAVPSTRFPLPSRLVRGRVPPEARARAGVQARQADSRVAALRAGICAVGGGRGWGSDRRDGIEGGQGPTPAPTPSSCPAGVERPHS